MKNSGLHSQSAMHKEKLISAKWLLFNFDKLNLYLFRGWIVPLLENMAGDFIPCHLFYIPGCT